MCYATSRAVVYHYQNAYSITHALQYCRAFCLLEILFLILEKMHVLDVNEIFWMPFYTYDRIMEEWGKNWPDAFALYVKLIKQSRIQQTNQTYSLNSFLKDWLKRTDERLKKSRDVLKWLWLINDVVIRDELGKIKWHYVRVNYLINENKIRTLGIDYNLSTTPEIQDVDKTMCGKSETNALSNININAWSNKKGNNTESDKLSSPKPESITPITNRDLTFEKIYNLFYHKSWHKPSLEKCKKVFDALNLDTEWYNMLVKDLKLFRVEYKYWVKDQKYRPWFEKYVGWFNAEWVNEEYRLKTIVKFHMENAEDIEKWKKRYLDLCESFWKDVIDKLVKEYGKNKNKITLKAD